MSNQNSYILPDFIYDGKCYNKKTKFIELKGWEENPDWAIKFFAKDYKFNWSQQFDYTNYGTIFHDIKTSIIAN